MTTALTNSVNTYWAQVGEQLGPETMVEYMKRFGFFRKPPLDFPIDELNASGVFNSDGELVEDGFDVGRVAIGQGGEEGQILATELQMAMVAAAVANDGKLMEPTFQQEVTDPDGRTSDELDPQEFSEVMSEDTASQVADMMTNVAEEGTASGLSVAGSTPRRQDRYRRDRRRVEPQPGPVHRLRARPTTRRSRSRRRSSAARAASAATPPARSRPR